MSRALVTVCVFQKNKTNCEKKRQALSIYVVLVTVTGNEEARVPSVYFLFIVNIFSHCFQMKAATLWGRVV